MFTIQFSNAGFPNVKASLVNVIIVNEGGEIQDNQSTTRQNEEEKSTTTNFEIALSRVKLSQIGFAAIIFTIGGVFISCFVFYCIRRSYNSVANQKEEKDQYNNDEEYIQEMNNGINYRTNPLYNGNNGRSKKNNREMDNNHAEDNKHAEDNTYEDNIDRNKYDDQEEASVEFDETYPNNEHDKTSRKSNSSRKSNTVVILRSSML